MSEPNTMNQIDQSLVIDEKQFESWLPSYWILEGQDEFNITNSNEQEKESVSGPPPNINKLINELIPTLVSSTRKKWDTISYSSVVEKMNLDSTKSTADDISKATKEFIKEYKWKPFLQAQHAAKQAEEAKEAAAKQALESGTKSPEPPTTETSTSTSTSTSKTRKGRTTSGRGSSGRPSSSLSNNKDSEEPITEKKKKGSKSSGGRASKLNSSSSTLGSSSKVGAEDKDTDNSKIPDLLDDLPESGAADYYFLLSGFPTTASQITSFEHQGIIIDLAVYLLNSDSADPALVQANIGLDGVITSTSGSTSGSSSKRKSSRAAAAAAAAASSASSSANTNNNTSSTTTNTLQSNEGSTIEERADDSNSDAVLSAQAIDLTSLSLSTSIQSLRTAASSAPVQSALHNMEWLFVTQVEKKSARSIYAAIVTAIYSCVSSKIDYRTWFASHRLVHLQDPSTSPDNRYYHHLVDSVSPAFISPSIILHCLIEQIVRNERGVEVNETDSIIESARDMNHFLDSTMTSLATSPPSPIIKSVQDEETAELVRAHNKQETTSRARTSSLSEAKGGKPLRDLNPNIVTWGDDLEARLSFYEPPSDDSVPLVNVVAVERHMASLLPHPVDALIPEPSERSTDEQLTEQAELSHFTGLATGPLTRSLMFLDFEDMLELQAQVTEDLSDRLFWQPLTRSAISQRFRSALTINENVVSSFFEEEDAMLVALYPNLNSARYSSKIWSSSVPSLSDYFEWRANNNSIDDDVSQDQEQSNDSEKEDGEAVARGQKMARGYVYDISKSQSNATQRQVQMYPSDGSIISVINSTTAPYKNVSTTIHHQSATFGLRKRTLMTPSSSSTSTSAETSTPESTTAHSKPYSPEPYSEPSEDPEPSSSLADEAQVKLTQQSAQLVAQLAESATTSLVTSAQPGTIFIGSFENGSSISATIVSARDNVFALSSTGRDGLVVQATTTGLIHQLQPESEAVETMRTICGAGSVISHRRNGDKIIMFANSNVAHYDSKTQTWTVTNSQGQRQTKSILPFSEPITLDALSVALMTDPESGQKVSTREDMVTTVTSSDAQKLTTTHADGTVIISDYNSDTITITCPGFAPTTIDSASSPTHRSSTTLAADGSSLLGRSGQVDLIKGPLSFVLTDRGLVRVRPHDDQEEVLHHKTESAFEVGYNFDLLSGTLSAIDELGNMFSVSVDGSAKARLVDPLIIDADESKTRLDAESHPASLFVIKRDGSGSEIMKARPVEKAKLLALRDPKTTVENTDGSLTFITLLRSSDFDTGQMIQPPSSSGSALPLSIQSFPDVTSLLLGSSIGTESLVSPRPEALESLPKAKAIIVRQLKEHSVLSEEGMNKLNEDLDRFEDWKEAQDEATESSRQESLTTASDEKDEAEKKLEQNAAAIQAKVEALKKAHDQATKEREELERWKDPSSNSLSAELEATITRPRKKSVSIYIAPESSTHGDGGVVHRVPTPFASPDIIVRKVLASTEGELTDQDLLSEKDDQVPPSDVKAVPSSKNSVTPSKLDPFDYFASNPAALKDVSEIEKIHPSTSYTNTISSSSNLLKVIPGEGEIEDESQGGGRKRSSSVTLLVSPEVAAKEDEEGVIERDATPFTSPTLSVNELNDMEDTNNDELPVAVPSISISSRPKSKTSNYSSKSRGRPSSRAAQVSPALPALGDILGEPIRSVSRKPAIPGAFNRPMSASSSSSRESKSSRKKLSSSTSSSTPTQTATKKVAKSVGEVYGKRIGATGFNSSLKSTSSSKSSKGGAVFKVNPSRLNFGRITDKGTVHKKQFSVTNTGVTVGRYKAKMKSGKSSPFHVAYLPGPVAPGMKAKIEVSLTPSNSSEIMKGTLDELQDQIEIQTETSVFSIPVSAKF